MATGRSRRVQRLQPGRVDRGRDDRPPDVVRPGGTAWPLNLRNFPLDELVSGLAAGALALLAATVQVASPHHAAPSAGLVMTAAALVAISRTWSVVPGAVLGLGGVAVTLAWLDLRRPHGGPSFAMAAVLIAPFAAVLAVDASPTGWVRGLVGVAVVLGARRIADRGRVGRRVFRLSSTRSRPPACSPPHPTPSRRR